MDDILFGQVKETFKNIPNDGLCSLLGQVMSFPEFRLQIAFITKLGYDVTIAITGEYLEAA